MFQVDSADTSIAETARTALGTIGFFNDDVAGAGTVVSAEIMNAIMKEMIELVVTIGGLSLDKADDTQLGQVLGHIRAIRSAVATTGTVTTSHLRTVLAATTSLASGANSAAMASTLSSATASNSVVLASVSGTNAGPQGAIIATSLASDIDSDSDNSAVIAATDVQLVDSDQSVGLASTTSIVTGGVRAAVIASLGATAAAGTNTLVAASANDATNNPAATGTNGAVLASKGQVRASGDQAMAGACANAGVGSGAITSGANSAIFGVTGGVTNSGANSVCVASDFDLDAGAISEPESVWGGDGNAKTWSIKSTTGKATFEKLRVNDGAAISGGSGPPTFAADVNGATGPGTNAQAQWLEVDIAGVAHWIPVWV